MEETAIVTKVQEAIKTKNMNKLIDAFMIVNEGAGTIQYAMTQPLLDRYVNTEGAEDNTVSAILFNPGAVPQQGAAAAIQLYQLQKKEFDNQSGRMSRFRSLIIQCLGKGDEAIFEGTRTSRMPLRIMFERLDADFRTRNPRREAELDATIKAKIQSGQSFREYVEPKLEAFKEMEEVHGIVISPRDKYKACVGGLANEEGLWTDGREMVQAIWESNNPTNETRTVARLTAAMKIHDDSKPRDVKAEEHFAGAAKGKSIKEEKKFCITESELEKMKEEWIRSRKGKNKGNGHIYNKNNNKGGAGGGGTAGQLKTFFCSTHGWNWTHHSRKCRFKNVEHKDDETEAQRRVRLPGDPGNDRC